MAVAHAHQIKGGGAKFRLGYVVPASLVEGNAGRVWKSAYGTSRDVWSWMRWCALHASYISIGTGWMASVAGHHWKE